MAIVDDKGRNGEPIDRHWPYARRFSMGQEMFQQPYLGAVERTQQEKLVETVSAADFGADFSSSSIDQYTALQKALDTGKSVVLEAYTYRLSQPLRYRNACQQIIGKGRRTVGGSRFLVDAAATQALICDSDDAGLTLYDCGITGVLFTRPSYADGTAITLNKAESFVTDRCIVQQFNRGADSFGSNVVLWRRFTVTAKKAGGWCVRLKGDSVNTGGIHVFENCTWDCTDNGFGTTGLGQEADGLVLEGAVATVTTYSLQVVRARRSIATVAGTEGAGLTVNPYFIYNYDFQSDRTGECGAHLAAGCDIVFDRGWIQGGYNAHNGGEGSALYIAPGVSKVTYKGHVGGSAYHGIDIGGSNVMIQPSAIARCSATLGPFPGYPYVSTTPNTYDNIIIRPTASDVSIIGGAVGTNENGPGLARYGVNVQAGATNIRVMGTSLLGNVSGPLNDSTTGEVQTVACTTLSQTETMRARGTGYLEFYNAQGMALRVGNTSGTLVNNFHIAGSATGTSVSMFAEGADASIGMLLAAKGAGVGRLRQDTNDRLTWDANRVDVTLPLRLTTFTVATVPSAATHARSVIYVSDGTSNKRLAISDGVNWRWPDGAIVS